VLDAFAGSGALGFEAASRGAAEVVLLESDALACRGLETARRRLGGVQMRIERADALAWMASMRRADAARFELILLDPPFGSGLAPRAAALAAPLLAEGGFLYVESGAPLAAPPEGLRVHRQLRAGAVHATLMRHDMHRYTAPAPSVPIQEGPP
jgi:16S rRNA G966 N2-methylase RsmD